MESQITSKSWLVRREAKQDLTLVVFPFLMVLDPGILWAVGPVGLLAWQDCVHLGPFSTSFTESAPARTSIHSPSPAQSPALQLALPEVLSFCSGRETNSGFTFLV